MESEGSKAPFGVQQLALMLIDGLGTSQVYLSFTYTDIGTQPRLHKALYFDSSAVFQENVANGWTS